MNRVTIRRILEGAPRQHSAGVRRSLNAPERSEVRDVTGGKCHVCGDGLGRKWQADHVVPVRLGGEHRTNNFLPICKPCNRLRWHYPPATLRLLLQIGVYAKGEISKGSVLGEQLLAMTVERSKSSRKRRAEKTLGQKRP